MQTPATTTGSEQGCEISENDISSEITQSTPLWIPDKKPCMWAFEWKVIQRSTCHGSQRKTISSSQLLQHKSCQSLLFFLPSGHFSFQIRGPPHSESEKQRGDLGCVAGEKEAHFRGLTFTQLRHHTLPTDRTSAGLRHTLSVHLGCPSFYVSLNKLQNRLWMTITACQTRSGNCGSGSAAQRSIPEQGKQHFCCSTGIKRRENKLSWFWF